ncbi:unnamed protein product [Rotaria socialis]|uniref:C3H1-type domain-containing protein n=1 Tax=Rotaria socialis TaxID=392032 RepID=A0A817QJG4_9BILA|nr:unnamed protein product [Rotaria socialis]CAF3398230.1 unnamed protein product [Rotaria socialis]CAF3412649.1 unnamed protein product [Rotaria socialis]CAF3511003.1 unnamed protein product [Rotaria socialis]CAF3562027.1 unnamed protein product [Rotaria socialis]
MSFSFSATAVDPHGTHFSSAANMYHQQYMSPLTGSSSSSTGGSPTAAVQIPAASVAANMPLLTSIANVKDSRWLTLEVCREFQRGKCTRSEQECKFAHPSAHVEVNSGKVIACFDSLKGKCNRTNPPCKYLHPPQHLRDILLQNGRNNLILRSIAMNIAANQAMYPQTATHLPYPNGAILQNSLQQSASLASYPQLSSAGPAQSALVFNQAGQAFSIPLHATHLQQLTQGTNATAMYSPDGAQYFQPVTQLAAQQTGPKITRTDRLEVCYDFQRGQCFYTLDTCPYAHPPAHCPLDADGLVTVCVDYVKGKCARETCKYFHPPDHLVAQLKAVKAQSVAAAAAHVYSAAAALQYSPSTFQFVQPVTLNSSQSILSASPTTYVYPQQTSIAPASSSPLQQQNIPEDDGTYANSFVSAYQPYPGHMQAIYARAPSVDLKDSTLMVSTNHDTSSSSSSSSTANDIKAAIDPVSSSSITPQTKKRPLEDDTATSGAYLQLPHGAQIIAAPQYIQQQQQTAVNTQHQKRSAVADPKTGIPMAAYPVTAFSYPSASPLPMQFQQPYLTAVPMTFTGYTSHLPRL